MGGGRGPDLAEIRPPWASTVSLPRDLTSLVVLQPGEPGRVPWTGLGGLSAESWWLDSSPGTGAPGLVG